MSLTPVRFDRKISTGVILFTFKIRHAGDPRDLYFPKLTLPLTLISLYFKGQPRLFNLVA